MSANPTAGLGEARAALVRFGQKMAADRLVVGSAGNLSVRLGETVLITPSGVSYDQIAEPSICVLDADGNLLDGDGKRSSEWPMHRRIYELTDRAALGGATPPDPPGHPGAGAVVHTHSPFATAVSTVCEELPAIHYTILRLGGPTVRVAPYTTFGSDGLAGHAADALDGRAGALLQNHGAIVHGKTLEEAYDRALLLEWLAEVYWRARLIGSPRILSEAELDEVSRHARALRYPGSE
jgi:L-fuculose-phosphate aldolase